MGFNNHAIRTYCHNHGISISTFAKQVGKSKTHLFNIVWEKNYPSPDLALLIEEITSGEVKAIDIVEPKKVPELLKIIEEKLMTYER